MRISRAFCGRRIELCFLHIYSGLGTSILAPGQLVLAIDRTIIEFAHEFGLRARRLSDLQNDLGGGALNSEVGYRFERFENGFTRITPIARIQLAPIRGIRVEAV